MKLTPDYHTIVGCIIRRIIARPSLSRIFLWDSCCQINNETVADFRISRIHIPAMVLIIYCSFVPSNKNNDLWSINYRSSTL